MNDAIHVSCRHCGQTNRVPVARLAEAPGCGACKRKLLEGGPIDLDDAGFARYLKRNDLPIVVDFWAAWCAPCKAMAPAFAAVADALRGRALFAKLETDRAPQTASAYNIRSIPTLIVFRGGKELARTAGALDERRLQDFVASHL